MTKLRPAQIRGPAKKLTPETLRENPGLASIIRRRAAEIRRLEKEAQAEPSPLPPLI